MILVLIVWLYVGFIVSLPVVFPVVWIIQFPIAVGLIFGVLDAFRCTILMTVGQMSVDSFDSVDIA